MNATPQQPGPYNQPTPAPYPTQPYQQQPMPAPYQPQRHVIRERKSASHGLHLVLTFLTCGMWAVTGWPIAAIIGKRKKTVYYS